ncbi:MAG TPA: sigma-70 family RNA polymerase sigma factor [Dongiaceae bacterium]|nr:sigma-70 family RNA polymerase sigma factor [Dongiaceae bacterium]
MLLEIERRARFEQLAVPLLDDAMRLAVWLAGSKADAEDIVQESMVRAYRYLDKFQGASFRPWLLAIVRNTAMTWLKRNRSSNLVLVPDFQSEEQSIDFDPPLAEENPEKAVLRRDLADQLKRAVAALPNEFREVIVLRELHDLSYKEIAAIIDAPIGTIMSRLSRARRLLMAALPEYAS